MKRNDADKRLVKLLEEHGFKILNVNKDYSTPATNYKLEMLNEVRLKRHMQQPGVYRMECVGGYDYYHTDNKIQVTSLLINDKEWMVDDPLHWHGMHLLAKNCGKKTLCVGLGLGLIQHALYMMNKEFETVEINSDVCNLMKNMIPQHTIHNIDVTKFERTGMKFSDYDTIILDIWAGTRKDIQYSDMIGIYDMVKMRAPKSKVYIWGIRDKEYNPAVEEDK